MAIVAVLALASCGGGSTTAGGRPALTPSEQRSTAQAGPGRSTTAEGGDRREAPGCEPGCRSGLGEFVGRMNDLRQALLAGLSYAEYVVRVRAIRDAYEAVPVGKLPGLCVAGAASDAEDAFNQYLEAANVWGECAGTEGCAASEIEGKLQRRWRTASKSLEEAQKG
jgi:hypothetical protein